MAEQFDVTVIGAGPGGYVAAIRAAQVGLKTAIIERDKDLGGTCLLRGCIPTKELLHSAHVYELIKDPAEFGVEVTGATLNFPAVIKRKNAIVSKLSNGVGFLMKKNKITVFKGQGKLEGKGRVTVTDDAGKVTDVPTKNVIIATGSAVRLLPGLTIQNPRIVTSDELLDFQHVPKSMVVLGAGAVGVEFASVFNRFGSEVTVIEMLDRLVPIEDEETSKELQRAFRKRKINTMVSTKFESCTVNADDVTINYTDSKGKAGSITAETLLVAIGRRPVTDGLGLENTKCEVERGYIKVDEYMRTAEPNVYAIGDVVPTPWLAHVASKEGCLAAEHIAGRNPRPINYNLVPNCTYCEPEIGSVGLTEAKAKAAGHEIKIGKFPFSALGKAMILGETEGFIKVIADAKYDEVLGVHMIGPHATDLLAEACVAMGLEATAEEFGHIMHAHPTLSEAVMEAAEAVHGMATSI
ncbi:MAG: dihydrolipoyl dehydrogenase [Acidobacteria bacterium]|nr:dihydrolipoyl dehydrogenase [Acidobacteriota bacterium]MBI3424027.1 dihydrolipoyl dehydrogenase [Acidobacteriota bacterium]